MSDMMWSPLHLSATLPTINVLNQELAINPQALLNPNRGPMLIDQFRFSGFIQQTTEGSPFGYLAMDPSWLAVEIRLGAVPLMPKPVCIAALCPVYQYPTNNTSAGQMMDSIFVWHLPKPLFVPKNVQIYTKVIARPMGVGAGFEPFLNNFQVANFRMSIAGRSLPEDFESPAQIAVPWATETNTSLSPNVSPFVSGDADLINPHQVPLYVQQFVGARHVGGAAGFQPCLNELTVQMTGSNGTAIIRDPTPWQLLFPEDRGLLEASCVLQPGQFVRTSIDYLYNTANGQTLNFATIGMIGHRMVPTPNSN